MEVKLNTLEKIKVSLRVFYKVTPWKEIFMLCVFTVPFCLIIDFDERINMYGRTFFILLFGGVAYGFIRWFLYKLIWINELKPFLERKFSEETEAMQKEAVENIDKELLVK